METWVNRCCRKCRSYRFLGLVENNSVVSPHSINAFAKTGEYFRTGRFLERAQQRKIHVNIDLQVRAVSDLQIGNRCLAEHEIPMASNTLLWNHQ